ncbi:MAG TPA: hypothetical protein VK988_00300 [Acidimicrobiales bacterium]|nr:hypothetical protein [Acidimicrobiales bacterium]
MAAQLGEGIEGDAVEQVAGRGGLCRARVAPGPRHDLEVVVREHVAPT